MKSLIRLSMIVLLAALSACTTVEYRNKYSILTLEDNLLQDNKVPPPAYNPVEYSNLSCDAKETFWITWSKDLMLVIGREHADKAGLRQYKATAEQKVKELNDAADKNNGK